MENRQRDSIALTYFLSALKSRFCKDTKQIISPLLACVMPEIERLYFKFKFFSFIFLFNFFKAKKQRFPSLSHRMFVA